VATPLFPRARSCQGLKSANDPFLLTMLLDVIEKSHEAEIHMQLLVAVEKG
jgi:hypothetical protein